MRKPERKSPTPFALSIALHVVIGVVLVRALTYRLPLGDLFQKERSSPPAEEHVSYVALPPQGAVRTPGRSGGNGRPVSPPLRAPRRIPSGLPPVAPAAPAAPSGAAQPPGGTGEVIGGGGPEQGVRPSYTGPRLWVTPAPDVSPPKSIAARLDSSLATRLRAYRDSVEMYTHKPTKMERGDWTIERNGEKYGIDRKFIHLGKFELPTAALAFLPLNRQANPIALEREQRLNAMHAEIWEQAQRAMNYEEFRNAAKAIRERKDRERAAARAAAIAAQNNQ